MHSAQRWQAVQTSPERSNLVKKSLGFNIWSNLGGNTLSTLWVKILIGFAIALALPILALSIMSFLSRRPDNLGLHGGKLADCPSSPNCVCTQCSNMDHHMEPIPYSSNPAKALEKIKTILTRMPRSKVIDEKDNYLHTEFTSALFRFVDDVEILVDPEAKVIHFRSASRAGHSDFGVNRSRMEQVRQQFTSGN